MKFRLTGTIAALSLASTVVCGAQVAVSSGSQPTTEKLKPSRGVISGTVYCADTNLPARLAQIVLMPTGAQAFGIQNLTTTDLDGRFVLPKVSEGRYYIAAILTGYLNPLDDMSESRLKAMSPEARKEFDAHVTTVAVSAKQAAEVSLRLERGAEIDGTVLYDDGSPAIGLQVELKPKTHAGTPDLATEPPSFLLMSILDRITR